MHGCAPGPQRPSSRLQPLRLAKWVRFHDTGIKRLHHPVVGDLSLSFNRLEVAADTGLTILAYAAQPGSRDEQALKLLTSWAATADAEPSRPLPGP